MFIEVGWFMVGDGNKFGPHVPSRMSCLAVMDLIYGSTLRCSLYASSRLERSHSFAFAGTNQGKRIDPFPISFLPKWASSTFDKSANVTVQKFLYETLLFLLLPLAEAGLLLSSPAPPPFPSSSLSLFHSSSTSASTVVDVPVCESCVVK